VVNKHDILVVEKFSIIDWFS